MEASEYHLKTSLEDELGELIQCRGTPHPVRSCLIQSSPVQPAEASELPSQPKEALEYPNKPKEARIPILSITININSLEMADYQPF